MVRGPWAGPVTGTGTINAFVRRLLSSQRSLARLVRADVAADALLRHRIDTAAQVTVVDLHNLDDRAKRFVVGVTLRRAFDDKERAGQHKPLLFVVLDELNKYAPRDGESPIKEILLDVAERGRSPRHHPHRRAADRERGRAAHHLQLVDPGRGPARRGRGRRGPSTDSSRRSTSSAP